MTQPQPDADLFELKSVLALVKIGKTSLYKAIKAGSLPGPVKIGRRSLWRASELKSAIAKLGKPTPTK